jgi:hypothetical protein
MLLGDAMMNFIFYLVFKNVYKSHVIFWPVYFHHLSVRLTTLFSVCNSRPVEVRRVHILLIGSLLHIKLLIIITSCLLCYAKVVSDGNRVDSVMDITLFNSKPVIIPCTLSLYYHTKSWDIWRVDWVLFVCLPCCAVDGGELEVIACFFRWCSVHAALHEKSYFVQTAHRHVQGHGHEPALDIS